MFKSEFLIEINKSCDYEENFEESDIKSGDNIKSPRSQ